MAHLLVALVPASLAPLPLARLDDAAALLGNPKGQGALLWGAGALAAMPEGCADSLVLVPTENKQVGAEVMQDARRVLKRGGLMAVAFLPTPGAPVDETAAALLMAGFVEAKAKGSAGVVAAAPKWSVGAAVPLKFARKNASNNAPAVAQVTLTADDLVDEDALLLDEDRAPPPAPAEDAAGGAGGCGSNPRKACANCSCGRAEALAKGEVPDKPKLTKEMLENPQTGGCGSCSLGDAFRCAGCPYRGLPAFKPGEKIVLSDAYDIQLDA